MPLRSPHLILPVQPANAVAPERWWFLGVARRFLPCSPSICARGLNRPWVEEDNWYGAVYAQAAHNNLRAGLHAAGVPATLYFGPLPIPPDAYYVHHPTLLPVLVTASFKIFGEAEWSTRLVPVLASLASVVVLWLLLRGVAGPRAATLGAAVFAAVPMELHYGDMVDFEPVLTLWMLALLLCIRHWENHGGPRWAAAGAIFAALALWTDWPGYLLVLSIAVWFVFRAPRGHRWFGWLLGVLVGLAGLLFLLQIRSANTAAWSDLWTALQMRLGNAIPTSIAPIAANAPRFTWGDWLRTVGADLRGNYLTLTWLCVGHGNCGRLLRAPFREATQAPCRCALARVGGGAIARRRHALRRAVAQRIVHPRLRAVLHHRRGRPARWSGARCGLRRRRRSFRVRRDWRLHVAVAGAIAALAVLGFRQSEEMRSPYLILDGVASGIGATHSRAGPRARRRLSAWGNASSQTSIPMAVP